MQQGEVETVAFWRHRGHKFGSPAMVASTPSSAEWPVLHSRSFHLPTSQEAPRAGPGLCCSSLTLHGHGMGLSQGRHPIKHQRLWRPGESLMACVSLRNGKTEAQRCGMELCVPAFILLTVGVGGPILWLAGLPSQALDGVPSCSLRTTPLLPPKTLQERICWLLTKGWDLGFHEGHT